MRLGPFFLLIPALAPALAAQDLAVSWSATGGRATAAGLYTAGSQPGSWRVVAKIEQRADTVAVTVIEPPSPLRPAEHAAAPTPAAAPAASDGPKPAGRGIPFGPFHLPVDMLGKEGIPFTATLWTVSSATLGRQLDLVRKAKGHILLAVARSKSKDEFGKLSAQAVGAELERWRYAVNFEPYLEDSTIIGIYLTDEPNCASCWGGTTANQVQVDSMAMLSKRIWPEAVTFARIQPEWFKSPPQYLDAAWASYDGPIRDGSPERYRDEQVAAAKARGLGLVLWLNTLDGGDGSSKMPGTFRNAAKVRRWQMSAAEVLRYGSVFLAEPYNCLAIHWQWSPAFKASRPFEQLDQIQAFDGRGDVRAAMDSVAKLAAERPASSCRRR